MFIDKPRIYFDQTKKKMSCHSYLGVVELEAVLHADGVADSHEVVVPPVVLRNHEEAQEAVREKHLHLRSPPPHARLSQNTFFTAQVTTRYGTRKASTPTVTHLIIYRGYVRKRENQQKKRRSRKMVNSARYI